MSEAENARRTIAKAEEVLRQCKQYFGHQAAMNAAAHMSDRVIHPPVHAAISSVLQAIEAFNASYPLQSVCKHCGLGIESTCGGRDWVHSEGPQQRLHRCAVEPYGYDAAPEGEACSHACLGSSTGNEGRVA